MSEDVSHILGDLSFISETLNKASDSLSKHILEVETALRRYRLGVAAWVNLDSWDEETGDQMTPPITRVLSLGYFKLKGNWGLVVADHFDDEPPSEENMRFLRNEARGMKLRAIDKLPNLLSELRDEAVNVAAETEHKELLAQEIVSALNNAKK